MKFPILIHLLNNKANHVVQAFEQMPVGQYFKIIKTNFVVDNLVIECDYRVIEPEPKTEVAAPNEPTQEDTESSLSDREGRDTSGRSEDSVSTSL